MKTNSYFIYNTWQGENESIPVSFSSLHFLTERLFLLSQESPYGESLSQITKFCEASFFVKDQSYFKSLFLCLEKENVIGSLFVQVLESEAEILFIGTKIEHLRKGIASELLNCFMNKLVQKNPNMRVFLEVGANNKPALLFYEKLGFKKDGLRKNYYKSGEDAWNMSLTLKDFKKLT